MVFASLPFVGSLETPNLDKWPLVFLVCFMAGTVLELAVGAVMNKVYGLQLWGYEGKWSFSFFKGRIALLPSLVWGTLGVVVVYFANPLLWRFLEGFSGGTMVWTAIILGLVFITDAIMSIFRLGNFRKLAKAKKNQHIDITDQYVAYVAKEIRNKWMPSVRKFIIKTLPQPDLLKTIGIKIKESKKALRSHNKRKKKAKK
jgi:uncharacterized membrane protein